jgi:hypothetical protein
LELAEPKHRYQCVVVVKNPKSLDIFGFHERERERGSEERCDEG